MEELYTARLRSATGARYFAPGHIQELPHPGLLIPCESKAVLPWAILTVAQTHFARANALAGYKSTSIERSRP